MDDTKHRRLFVVRELNASAAAIPRLLAKIDEVLQLEGTTDSQAIDVEWIAESVERLLLGIRKAVHDNDFDRLTAAVDRLREEIATGEETLDRLLQQMPN